MKMKPEKISSLLLYTGLGITVVIVAVFYLGGSVTSDDGYVIPRQTSLLLNWMYGLAGIIILCLAGFSCLKFIRTFRRNPRTFWRNFLVFFGLAVLLVFSWLAGSGEALQIENYRGTGNVWFWLKASDMFLYAVYVLLGLIILVLTGINIYHTVKK